jgi:hypothetical protein
MTDCCANCQCFHAGSKIANRHNLCRRYPPQVVSIISPQGTAVHTQFPVADPDGWCGEHKRKEDK